MRRRIHTSKVLYSSIVWTEEEDTYFKRPLQSDFKSLHMRRRIHTSKVLYSSIVWTEEEDTYFKRPLQSDFKSLTSKKVLSDCFKKKIFCIIKLNKKVLCIMKFSKVL
jgi:hypothetical protein